MTSLLQIDQSLRVLSFYLILDLGLHLVCVYERNKRHVLLPIFLGKVRYTVQKLIDLEGILLTQILLEGIVQFFEVLVELVV